MSLPGLPAADEPFLVTLNGEERMCKTEPLWPKSFVEADVIPPFPIAPFRLRGSPLGTVLVLAYLPLELPLKDGPTVVNKFFVVPPNTLPGGVKVVFGQDAIRRSWPAVHAIMASFKGNLLDLLDDAE